MADETMHSFPCPQEEPIKNIQTEVGNIKEALNDLKEIKKEEHLNIKESIKETKGILEERVTAFHAEMISNHDVEVEMMRQMLKKQDKTNGNVLEHDQLLKRQAEQLIARDKVIDQIQRDTAIIQYIKQKPLKAIMIFLTLVVIGAWVADKLQNIQPIIKTIMEIFK
jgi:hypothetical protein